MMSLPYALGFVPGTEARADALCAQLRQDGFHARTRDVRDGRIVETEAPDERWYDLQRSYLRWAMADQGTTDYTEPTDDQLDLMLAGANPRNEIAKRFGESVVVALREGRAVALGSDP